VDHRCFNDFRLPTIVRDFPWWWQFRWWKRLFSGCKRCQRPTPSQPEQDKIFLEAIWQTDGAGQLQCLQHVGDSISGWVSWKTALLHYLDADLFDTVWWWTPAEGDSSCMSFEDIWKLAAIGYFSITLNGFGRTRCRWFSSNVQGKFRRQGQWKGEATCDRRQIWESLQTPWPKVTS